MFATSRLDPTTALSRIKTGDLIAWKKRDFGFFASIFMWLYQKIKKETFVAVGVVIKLGGRSYVVETTPGAVRLTAISTLDDYYWADCKVKGGTFLQTKSATEFLGKKISQLDVIKRRLGFGGGESGNLTAFYASHFYSALDHINTVTHAGHYDILVSRLLDGVKDFELVHVKRS